MPDLLDVYRSMTVEQLMTLRTAFEEDRAYAQKKAAVTVGFCDERLALIQAVLKERKVHY